MDRDARIKILTPSLCFLHFTEWAHRWKHTTGKHKVCSSCKVGAVRLPNNLHALLFGAEFERSQNPDKCSPAGRPRALQGESGSRSAEDVLCHCGDRPPPTVICCQGAAGRTSLSHYWPAEGVRANGLLVQGESRQLRTDRSSASRPEPVT